MAGGRRRHSHAPATTEGDAAPATIPPNTSASPAEGNTTRVTRSSRGNRDADAGRNNHAGPRPTNRPSRIVVLKTGPGRNPAATETRTSQGQSAPSTSTQPASLSPHTPRARRPRRSIAIEESPKSTRHSARLKAQTSFYSNDDSTLGEDEEDRALDAGSPGGNSDNETRNTIQETQDGAKGSFDRNSSNTTPPIYDDPIPESAEKSDLLQGDDTQAEGPESNPVDQEPQPSPSNEGKNGIQRSFSMSSSQESLSIPGTTPTPTGLRKRKSYDLEKEDEYTDASVSPTKKAKMDEDDVDRASEQNGVDEKKEPASSVDGPGEFKVKDEPDQADTTPETGIGFPPVARGRGGRRGGRGRRRGRGGRPRATARANAVRRGTGRGRARGFRGGRIGRPSNMSDDECRRSPSPSAEAQKLRDRQRELDKAFRKLAAAQRLALAELASQSEKRVTREKNAHITVAEYDQTNMQLKERLRMKQESLRHEYELEVEQEMRILEAEKDRINENFRRSAQYIKEEHLRAAQGGYMSFVEGQRAAEDDEHTETDDSEAESAGIIPKPVEPNVRGFNSSSVRAPGGASAYQLAAAGWDDFLQRAKVSEDISPEMREMGQPRDRSLSSLPPKEALTLLVQASGVVEQESKPSPELPNGLPILAEAAAARPPAMQRTLLPQIAPGPSFILPRPQPRRLLPAGQMLPDPFAGHGPPQLPPPPGSNFQRPPMPGFLPGQPFYYPPPPPRRPPY